MSLKDKLSAYLDRPTLVPTTFVGEQVFIKPWNELEKKAWATKSQELVKSDDVLVRCHAIVACLSDADGHLVYREDEAEKVARFPSNEIGRLFHEIIEVQSEPDFETLKKSSAATTN